MPTLYFKSDTLMSKLESRLLNKYATEFKQSPETAFIYAGSHTYYDSKGNHVNPLGANNLSLSCELVINFNKYLLNYLQQATEILKNREEFQYIREIFESLKSSFEEDEFIYIDNENDCTYMKYLKECPLQWFIYAIGSEKIKIYENELKEHTNVRWKLFDDKTNDRVYFSIGPRTDLVLAHWYSSDGRIYIYTVYGTLYTWIKPTDNIVND